MQFWIFIPQAAKVFLINSNKALAFSSEQDTYPKNRSITVLF